MVQYSQEVHEVIAIARKTAIQLGRDVSSDVVLHAIIEHGDNSGVKLLEANGANLTKIRASLKDRLKQIAREMPVDNPTPRMSAGFRKVLNYAEMISTNGTLNATAIVHALFSADATVAGKMLHESGYSEPGSTRPRVTSTRAVQSNTPALNAFSTDLTSLAQDGKLDPVIGRENEISRVIEILARRKKNNPALVGEPGVGKTAIVEGLAIRIVSGNVPKTLADKRILTLDLNSIVAGTQFRGQFEQRMQAIIKELSRNPDIIVFIDEMHSLMGTGGTEGTGDAANIIKPALSRGQIRCIGATTANEYRKHIEKDGALDRRFQKIMVEQPTLEETATILKQSKQVYEAFHGVAISDESVELIVSLTERYIQDRFFPDKAIDVMDEAGATSALHGGNAVTPDMVRAVISKISGVPVTSLSSNEREKLKHIQHDLSAHVIGQDAAIDVLANSIKRKRTGVKSDKRPSTFLFLGPTGVGKTELARQLAKYLFDSEQSLIRLDMSEFFDRFTISSLIGAPPGYVGFDEGGGKLTEKVRKKPYSVVLLDEIEKAHPDVFNVLLQIFDDGILTDAQGRTISFKNTIIIITSNLGADTIGKRGLGFANTSANEEMQQNLQAALKRTFKPEFINRLDEVVMFNKLSRADMAKILRLMMDEINTRFQITYDPSAENWLLDKGYSDEYGARPMRRLIEKEIESRVADLILDEPTATSFSITLKNDMLSVEVVKTAE